jgi:hypothetical protein
VLFKMYIITTFTGTIHHHAVARGGAPPRGENDRVAAPGCCRYSPAWSLPWLCLDASARSPGRLSVANSTFAGPVETQKGEQERRLEELPPVVRQARVAADPDWMTPIRQAAVEYYSGSPFYNCRIQNGIIFPFLS